MAGWDLPGMGGNNGPPTAQKVTYAPGAHLGFTPIRLVAPSGDHVPGDSSSPLDPSAQISLQQAAAARQTYLSQQQQQQQQEEQNYGDQLFDIHQQHPLDTRALLNNYAARGMAFGSGYGDASTQLSDNYATNLARLAAARTAALSGFSLNKSNYTREYGLDLSAIREAAADRLSQNAGSLGLKDKNKSKAKTLQGN